MEILAGRAHEKRQRTRRAGSREQASTGRGGPNECEPRGNPDNGHTRNIRCVSKVTRREDGADRNRAGTEKSIMAGSLVAARDEQAGASGCQHNEGKEQQGWVRRLSQRLALAGGTAEALLPRG